MKIVFVHGWGGDASYWDGLAAALDPHTATILDLGFTGPAVRDKVPDEPALYITHSLGTMWALRRCSDKMTGLVAINGFSCFREFTDNHVLQTMQAGLEKNAKAQMRVFLRAADMSPIEALNEGGLSEGLKWLEGWDERESLKSLQDRGCPVIAFNGAYDRIVPLSAAQMQFKDVRICEDGGHNLAQTHVDWCAEHIKNWVKIHNVETAGR